jgi:hypothetical protein
LRCCTLLHRDPRHDSIVKAGGRLLSEERAEVDGNRNILEGKAATARYFGS